MADADAEVVNLYNACKSLALGAYCNRKPKNQDVLITLKEKFKDIINSPRSLEYINDIHSLIDLLEVRGALNYGNINILEQIFYILNVKNTKILEDYKNLIRRKLATPNQDEEVENQSPLRNTAFQSRATNEVFSENFQTFEDVNSNTGRLSERAGPSRKSKSKNNPPRPANASRPPHLHKEEDIFPIPILLLLSEIVTRLCNGNSVNADGTTSIENNGESNVQQQKDPSNMVDMIFIYIMIVSFSICMLYIIYEFISIFVSFSICMLYIIYEFISIFVTYFILVFGFFIQLGFLFFFLKVVAMSVNLTLKIFQELLWFRNNIREEGVKKTLYHCGMVLFEDIKNSFLNEDTTVVEKPLPAINFLSVNQSLFKGSVWLILNVYKKGVVSTVQCCFFKLLRQIELAVQYWNEPEIQYPNPNENNQVQNIKAQYTAHLAAKLSTLFNNLYHLFAWIFIDLFILICFKSLAEKKY